MNENESPRPRVTRITVGRLYNLGRYEHKRYEISVEIPGGSDASAAMRALNDILWNLRPIRVDSYELQRAQNLIKKVDAGEQITAWEMDGFDAARQLIAKVEADKARITEAVNALNALAGKSEYRDAKDEWDLD